MEKGSVKSAEQTPLLVKTTMVTEPPTSTTQRLYWVFVAFVCTMTQVMYSLIEGTMGVLQLELVHAFEISIVTVTTMTIVQFSVSTLGALPSSLLMSRFGKRPVLFIGSLLVGIGYLSSAFVNSYQALFVTFSVIIGMGASTFQITSMYTIQRYFSAWRALAQGLAMAGQSVGQFIWPPVTEVLIRTYGWRGAFLILAGIGLQCCIFALLLPHPYPEERNTIERSGEPTKIELRGDSLSAKEQLKSFYESLNVYVIIFYVGVLLETLGHHIPLLWLPTIGIEKAGMSSQAAAFLVSFYALSSGLSRVLIGALGDLRWLRQYRSVLMAVMLLGTGITSMLLTLAEDRNHLIVYAVFQGIFSGGYVSLSLTVLVDIAGQHNAAILNALILFTLGFGALLANPFASWLISLPAGFKSAILICGGCQVLGGSLVLPAMLKFVLKQAHSSDIYEQSSHVTT